jgi:hypothetical protein
VRLVHVEHVSDCLTFRGGQCGNVDQRLHLLVPGGADHGARIGMPHQYHRAIDAFQSPIESGDIVGQGSQWQGSRNRLEVI